jgi:predicted phage terminase large subunit-like protein
MCARRQSCRPPRRYPDLRRKVIALAEKHQATTIVIEDAGPGQNLLQDLRHDPPTGMTYPIGKKPEGSKAERMAAQSAKIEAGHLNLCKDAPWLAEFLTEVLAFPAGRHDDQVDALSQFLHWAESIRSQTPTVSLFGPKIIRG